MNYEWTGKPFRKKNTAREQKPLARKHFFIQTQFLHSTL